MHVSILLPFPGGWPPPLLEDCITGESYCEISLIIHKHLVGANNMAYPASATFAPQIFSLD